MLHNHSLWTILTSTNAFDIIPSAVLNGNANPVSIISSQDDNASSSAGVVTILVTAVVGLFTSVVIFVHCVVAPQTKDKDVNRPKVIPIITPPCERIIEEAEQRNRRNGHENAGFLSKEAGFAPLQPPTMRLPTSHAAWDQLASDLPRLVQTQTVRETVTNGLPLLDASAAALADRYLQRAASILGLTAHVFVRMEGSEPLTLKYESHSEILPPALEVPWTIVCQRLGRPVPSLTYVDGVVANYRRSSNGNDLQLLIPTVGNREERAFIGVMIAINRQTTPILHQIIEAQRQVLAGDPAALKRTIRQLYSLLNKVTETLARQLHANRAHRAHIDPVLWTLTVANLGIPWVEGAVGAAGTAHPFFHMMDEFTGRAQYATGIGHEAQVVRATYPQHWRRFLAALREVSVPDYVAASRDPELRDLWAALVEGYRGSNDSGGGGGGGGGGGLLGFHRRKVFGFLAVSFRIGRSTTINGLGRRRRTEPWLEADQALEQARLERRQGPENDNLQKSHVVVPNSPPPPPPPTTKPLPISQLIVHNSPETGYWFAAQGRIYDATSFLTKHPGGDTVIALCSGQDVTESLAAVGHLSHPATRRKLDSFCIGALAPPPPGPALVPRKRYLAATALGFKAAEVENIHRTNFQILDGQLTGLDEARVLTPQKARHLQNARARLQDEYIPALAGLLEALRVEVSSRRSHRGGQPVDELVARLTAKRRRPETVVALFTDYATAVDMLHRDLRRLREVKELVATVLAAWEEDGGPEGFCVDVAHERRLLETTLDTLKRVATALVVLAER
ncbi:uncharacterized protein BO97DRAFT_462991 [Aspergillus homomorphus CBS 101889]|uniref:Indoleamine 2,3-dioxygenase n=1 Tax=Aspergillus homomorphus (strain CBS 101889) TaxID=1450537 RepID=A0A395IAF9_ASPHC|nr:hypothetical protein BO97DRAFT_462991 [Aspergillus homomorphus CBS 101889]RAL15144.1 hypothetical protein BO97DRAFT_462991 [Aspergillus homomorphus CBS 101889]